MSELNSSPVSEPPLPGSREERRAEREERREQRRLERANRRHGIFWPLFLIAAGVLFLLYNVGLITGVGWSFILSLWPVLLIVGGLDGLWRGEGIAGSLFWLGLGVIFLLANLGFLPISVWTMLWRFWPVLLVVIGLDIIIGHRPGVGAQVLSIVLALAILGGLVWYVVTQPALQPGTALTGESVTEPLQGATSARVEVSMAAGQLNVAGGADAANLVQGRVDIIRAGQPQKNISVTNGQAVFTLKEEGAVNIGDNNNRTWDLKFNSAVPTGIKLNLGAGQNNIDLTGMQVTSLDVNIGAGQTIVTLPKDGKFTGRINGAVGELVLRVPRDLPVQIQANRALTGLDVDSDFQRAGNTITNGSSPQSRLDLTIPVGSIRLELVP